jgi:hypothetical protein
VPPLSAGPSWPGVAEAVQYHRNAERCSPTRPKASKPPTCGGQVVCAVLCVVVSGSSGRWAWGLALDLAVRTDLGPASRDRGKPGPRDEVLRFGQNCFQLLTQIIFILISQKLFWRN